MCKGFIGALGLQGHYTRALYADMQNGRTYNSAAQSKSVLNHEPSL